MRMILNICSTIAAQIGKNTSKVIIIRSVHQQKLTCGIERGITIYKQMILYEAKKGISSSRHLSTSESVGVQTDTRANAKYILEPVVPKPHMLRKVKTVIGRYPIGVEDVGIGILVYVCMFNKGGTAMTRPCQ